MELELWQFAVLFAAAFFGGFIDSIAGGGGLISLPALLAVGIPPHVAIATNRFQGSFGSFTAALNFIRKGYVDAAEILRGVIFTFIGGLVGAYVLLLIDAKFLNYLIPILLLALFFYMIFSPNLGEAPARPKMSKNSFYAIFGLFLGFYDGFFGPGTGSFWTFALVGILGLYMKKAVAHTKVLNFTSNIVSLSVFIIGGQILWLVGAVGDGGRTDRGQLRRLKLGDAMRRKIRAQDAFVRRCRHDFKATLRTDCKLITGLIEG